MTYDKWAAIKIDKTGGHPTYSVVLHPDEKGAISQTKEWMNALPDGTYEKFELVSLPANSAPYDREHPNILQQMEGDQPYTVVLGYPAVQDEPIQSYVSHEWAPDQAAAHLLASRRAAASSDEYGPNDFELLCLFEGHVKTVG